MSDRRVPLSVVVLLAIGAACLALALVLLGTEVPAGNGMAAVGKMLVGWSVLLFAAPLLLIGVAGVLVHVCAGPRAGGRVRLPRAQARQVR